MRDGTPAGADSTSKSKRTPRSNSCGRPAITPVTAQVAAFELRVQLVGEANIGEQCGPGKSENRKRGERERRRERRDALRKPGCGEQRTHGRQPGGQPRRRRQVRLPLQQPHAEREAERGDPHRRCAGTLMRK